MAASTSELDLPSDGRFDPRCPFLGASVAVFRDGRVMLASRGRAPMEGLYSLPGGGVESGETLAEAALAALTREMAADFGPLGVRVNAISPGEIDTSILSPGTEKIVEQIPMRRLGTPDEVAKAIYFLCTEASSYVNGAELHINGGQHV